MIKKIDISDEKVSLREIVTTVNDVISYIKKTIDSHIDAYSKDEIDIFNDQFSIKDIEHDQRLDNHDNDIAQLQNMGGSGYDDTALRDLITTNANDIATKADIADGITQIERDAIAENTLQASEISRELNEVITFIETHGKAIALIPTTDGEYKLKITNGEASWVNI